MYQVAAKRGGIPKTRALDSQVVRGGDNSMAVWVLAGAVFLAAILCVWSRARVISLGYEISKESRHLLELKETNEGLRAELAMLKAPGRLEPIARRRLNLSPPKNHQIVLLR